MQALRCIRIRHPTDNRVHVNRSLNSYVFVSHDAVRKPLQPLYDDPFRVLDRSDKFFTLDLNGRIDTVSIDRLKPAYVDDLATTTSTVDMPLSPTSPPVTSLPSQPTATPHGSQSLDPRATRSGRRVHWPAHLVDFSLGHWEGSYDVDISVTVMLPLTNCMSYLTKCMSYLTNYIHYFYVFHSSSLDLVYHYIFSS